jgi:hypothetical protein
MRRMFTSANDCKRLTFRFATSYNLALFYPSFQCQGHKGAGRPGPTWVSHLMPIGLPVETAMPGPCSSSHKASRLGIQAETALNGLAQAGAFLTHKAHQPVGAMSPSTILQPFGAMKKLQPSHCRSSFGVA